MTLNNKTRNTSLVLKIIKFFVCIYDFITYPIYYFVHKPYVVLERAKKVRAKLENSADPYSAWIRIGIKLNHYLNECKTLVEAQHKTLEIHGRDKQCLGFREIYAEEEEIQPNGKVLKKLILSDYKWLSFGEVDDRIGDIARGLLIHGIKPKDTVLIFAETRVEWFLSAQAIVRIGASITTLYATLGTDGLIHGINETEVTHIITTEDLLQKLSNLQNRIQKINTIIYIELKYKSFPKSEFSSNISLVTFDRLENDGHTAPEELCGVTPSENDVALIQYTSGSTGQPKGVILTHKNILSSFRSVLTITDNLLDAPEKQIYLAYLPLTHNLEFTAESLMHSAGIKIGYGTPFTLTNTGTALKKGTKGDIILLKPTLMASVPLILDRIRKEIELNVGKKIPFFRELFYYAIRYKIFWEKKGFRTPVINNLICKKINQQLGGDVILMMTGGAPLSPDTQQFLRACLNIKLCQGFGSTETNASATSMDMHDLTCGLIGAPLFGIKIKLIDWEEGGYRVTDKPNSRGEAIVGGNNVAKGYFKLDEQTREVFEDMDGIRWFKTGDIVEVNSQGLFKIIDRKKDFVKLQFGEYISLGKVESELKNCKYVDNICVYGDSYHTYLVAMIIPNVTVLKNLAKDLNISSDSFEIICNNEMIIENVAKELLKFGLSVCLLKMEIPLKIKLCSEEWTTSNALVTPAMKIRRKNIQNFYQKFIDKMYDKI